MTAQLLESLVDDDGHTWETWRYDHHLMATDPDGTRHYITGTVTSADFGQLDLGIVRADPPPDLEPFTAAWSSISAEPDR